MSQLTITQDGNVLTETAEGVTMPADYSFACVNDYIHGVDRYFEELQWLALGMATEIEKAHKQRDELKAKISSMENHAAIGRAIYRACEHLPEGYDMHIECERGAGGVRLHLCDTDADINYFGDDITMAQEIDNAINIAIAHAEKVGAA